MRVRTVGALLAVALFPGAAFAAPFEIDGAHSSVGFRIRHLVSRVNGAFTEVKGTIEWDEKQPAKSRVSATIGAASVNTHNDKRDEHLKSADFFDAGKYPTITFRSKKVTPAGKGRFRVLGNLTMHGVTKPVVLNVTYGGQAKDPWGGKRAGFGATTRLNRKDFGITYNQVLDRGGTVLGNDVEISMELEAVQKK